MKTRYRKEHKPLKRMMSMIACLVLGFSATSFGSDMDRNISSLSPSAKNQRLEALRKSLSGAKGEKRSTIMKKIARFENEAFELKRKSKSSASRR